MHKRRYQQMRRRYEPAKPENLEQIAGISILDPHLFTQFSVLNNNSGLLVISGLHDFDFDTIEQKGYSKIIPPVNMKDHTMYAKPNDSRVEIGIIQNEDKTYTMSVITRGEDSRNSFNLVKQTIGEIEKTSTPIPEGLFLTIKRLQFDELEEHFPRRTQESCIALLYEQDNFWCYEREGSYFRSPIQAATLMTLPYSVPGIFQHGITNKMIQHLLNDGDHFYRRSIAYRQEIDSLDSQELIEYNHLMAWSDLERTRLIHQFMYKHISKDDLALQETRAINLGYCSKMTLEQLTIAQQITTSYHAIEFLEQYTKIMQTYTEHIKTLAKEIDDSINEHRVQQLGSDSEDCEICFTQFETELGSSVQYFPEKTPEFIATLYRDFKRNEFIIKELHIPTSLVTISPELLPYDLGKAWFKEHGKNDLAQQLTEHTREQRCTDPLFLARQMPTPFDELITGQ